MSFTSDTLVFPVELPGSKPSLPEPFLVELAIGLTEVSFHLLVHLVVELDRPLIDSRLRSCLAADLRLICD